MTDITFTSEISANLLGHAGSDLTIAQAAWVSTRNEGEEERIQGLLNYLMKHRHGCYDDETEVLTRQGFKPWPEVTEDDELCTMVDGWIEYEKPSRVIHKPYQGEMVRIKAESLDLLVTPDHQIYASHRNGKGWQAPFLQPASIAIERNVRFLGAAGGWIGNGRINHALAEFVGFFIGDGYNNPQSRQAEFHLKRERKISYLISLCHRLSLPINVMFNDKYVIDLDEDTRKIIASCYNNDREKIIPEDILSGNKDVLWGLQAGLWNSDGHSANNRETYSTTSKTLADQIQILAMRIGRRASIIVASKGGGHFGYKTVYNIRLFQGRKENPEIGRTLQSRRREVSILLNYNGHIHCATVSSGLLYVRRNGLPVWCGNSPFEQGWLQFELHIPIFVARELVRHRIGVSINEMSGRYTELEPIFWVSREGRGLINVGTSARPKMAEGNTESFISELKHSYEWSWLCYQRLINQGYAKEVARVVLPVGVYTRMHVTFNPRSLMHFLSLRVHDDRATFATYPMAEIQELALHMEGYFSMHWPRTYLAFANNGRVSP